MAPAAQDVKALSDLLSSTAALLAKFNAAIKASNHDRLTTHIRDPPNPLRVLGDTARLVKAHTTKLSLLAINKPFTPSAVFKVIKELAETVLPAMLSAVQICEQEQATWTRMLWEEVGMQVGTVFREMETMLAEVRSISDGREGGVKRDSLSSTGIVWETCDGLIELEKMGVVGLAVRKAGQSREIIKDAIEELREWTEQEDPDTEGRGDSLLDSDDEGVDGDRDSLDDIFNAPNSMPKDRPELRAAAEEVNVKLRKIVLLFDALIKRRIQTFVDRSRGDSEAKNTANLDSILFELKRLPHRIDDLIGALYDLDEVSARQKLATCVDQARKACEMAELDWSGQEDRFTAWSKQWNEAIS